VFLLAPLLAALSACSAPAPSAPSYVVLSASSAAVASPWSGAAWQEEEAVVESEGGGVIHGVLMYLPNRIFDVFDIVRARVRLGPGIGVGVRATELADVFVGFYSSVFVGIHGPRGEPKIPWPVGFESLAGVEVSVADGTTGGATDPNYGMVEFGADAQILIVGFAVGVEPFEVLDFVLGFLTIDFAEDDF